MAKKPAKKPVSRGSSARQSPATLRKQVEKLDRELLKLIQDRAKLIGQTARLEDAELGSEVDERDLNEIVTAANGPLPENAVRSVFRELFSGCRSLINVVRVAYLGPAYSYSHLAAIHRFGRSADLVPVGGIRSVFEEVHNGHCRFGLVPLENSTDGRIADTLEMFTRLPVRICGEVPLVIHHNLLAKCPRSEVQELYSRPQAISQCRNWLSRHLPGVRLIEMISTSDAAQFAQQKPGAAAIASVEAAAHYGLDVLAANVEDNDANTTRFAVIGQQPGERSGRDKTAVMFQIDHKIGALADATAVFKRNKLNMTWIESFPIPDEPGAYLFFVEVEGHERDPKVKRAMDTLARRALRLEVLGSYARSSVA